MTKKTKKAATVREGVCVIYRGQKLDLRKLMFAMHCVQNGVSPWDGSPLTSKKGGAS